MFDALNPSDDLVETQAASTTSHLLDELALFGHRPYQDDPDPRPLPEPEEARCAMIGIFSTAQDLLCDTRLEDDLPEILWGFVNTFHRKLDRIERELDDNEVAQRRSQGEQDGSEVRSVELERLIDQGKEARHRGHALRRRRRLERRPSVMATTPVVRTTHTGGLRKFIRTPERLDRAQASRSIALRISSRRTFALFSFKASLSVFPAE